eukprot:m.1099652 g.1099652  ORF g.1099652 m.1099652 type:complete len:1044 (-) comp24317_c0_seq9:356-3487(-)
MTTMIIPSPWRLICAVVGLLHCVRAVHRREPVGVTQRDDPAQTLLPYGSKWRLDLSGVSIPDGDVWWIGRPGVGWLDENYVTSTWEEHVLPISESFGGSTVSQHRENDTNVPTDLGPSVMASCETLNHARITVMAPAQLYQKYEEIAITMQSQVGVRVVLHIAGVPVVALTAAGEIQPSSAVIQKARAVDAVRKIGKNVLESTVVVDSALTASGGKFVVAVQFGSKSVAAHGKTQMLPSAYFDAKMVYQSRRSRYSSRAGGWHRQRRQAELPILYTANWKYLDDGSDQGNAWRASAFDDSAWSEGAGQLGYGDGDESTVVSFGGNPLDKHITTYFRKRFVVANASYSLDVDITYDDGCVIYLNGAEIQRFGMPTGAISYTTLSNSDGATHDDEFTINSGHGLALGTNVLAVEVHQISDSSSDISWALAAALTTPHTEIVSTGAAWRYFDDGRLPSADWYDMAYDDSTWASGDAPLGYGNGDEATTVSFGSDSNEKHSTTYFRHAAGAYIHQECTVSFLMTIQYDDGFVAYINGVEVARHNMPTGAIGHATFAMDEVGDEDTFYRVEINVSAVPLLDRGFVIAVEVHQRSSSSSDIRLDMYVETCGCDSFPDVVNYVTRHPYLQALSSTAVTVKWSTFAGNRSAGVWWGTAPSALTSRTPSRGSGCQGTRHTASINGLLPNTQYYYRAEGDTETFSFTTPLDQSARDSFMLWYLGDPGTNYYNQRNTRDAFCRYRHGVLTGGTGTATTCAEAFSHADRATHPLPDVMVLGGDNAYPDGTETQYEFALFRIYDEFISRLGLWATFGNHDDRSADAGSVSGAYFDIFDFPENAELNHDGAGAASGTHAYYSFDHGAVHVVCLDSQGSDRAVDGVMATWLVADLTAAAAADVQVRPVTAARIRSWRLIHLSSCACLCSGLSYISIIPRTVKAATTATQSPSSLTCARILIRFWSCLGLISCCADTATRTNAPASSTDITEAAKLLIAPHTLSPAVMETPCRMQRRRGWNIRGRSTLLPGAQGRLTVCRARTGSTTAPCTLVCASPDL